ncbi:MAG TPA: alanine racemase [Peptostreptococcaceae bacterium]|nr:alanine racemase [Peptostreptococcaceae bacterium]
MLHRITAPTWAEINLDNIRFNLRNIKKLLKEDTKICGVVKANAYGHGSVEISKVLINEGVDYLAVARLEEAIELRQSNIIIPILCLGYIDENSLEDAVKNDIYITVYSYESAYKLNEICKKLGKKSKIHIKIDTGMSRIGFLPNTKSVDDIQNIYKLSNIIIEGIYTHFAVADEKDKDFTYKQVDRINYIIKELENRDVYIPIKHVSNSAATMDCYDLHFNMVRCGIILYGHYPSDDVKKEVLPLKPTMTLKTKVAHIKELDSDVGISYGLRYKTVEKAKIATLPIGYADGFTRLLTDKAKVKVNGKIFPVVGKICMDQCMIKINENDDIKIGDEVIIFGEGDDIRIENLANELETINYEMLCMIARRVERVYVEGNVILQKTNYLIK